MRFADVGKASANLGGDGRRSGKFMDFDREERRLLAALWIDHHGRDRLLSAGDLTVDYGVRLPDRWLESMAVTLEGKGWATVYRSLSDVALGLRPEGYRP